MNISSISLSSSIRNNQSINKNSFTLQPRFSAKDYTDDFSYRTTQTEDNPQRIQAQRMKKALCGQFEIGAFMSFDDFKYPYGDDFQEKKKQKTAKSLSEEEIQKRILAHRTRPKTLEQTPDGFIDVSDEINLESARANLESKLYTTSPEKLNQFFDDLIETCPEVFDMPNKKYAELQYDILSDRGFRLYENTSDKEKIKRLKMVLTKLFEINPEAFAKYFAIRRENAETPFVDNNNPINSIKNFIKNIFQPK